MSEPTIDRLGRLNRYQVAGLAVLTSTFAAVGVLLLIRRFLLIETTGGDAGSQAETDQPDVPEAMGTTIPHHFSENLIVPGLTKTGQEILTEDDRDGRSPEGV